MIRIKNFKLLLSVLIVIMIFGMECAQKGQSMGSLRNIVVLADSLLWEQVDDSVTPILSTEKYTPQPEKIFVLNRIDPGRIGELKKYSQILLIGTLDQQGVTKNLLDQLLPAGSKGRQLVENNERFFFQVKDPWSREQLLGVLVSNDLPTLLDNLKTDNKTIFDAFDQHVNSRVFNQAYYTYEQKNIEKKLMNQYGWSIRVPHDYVMTIDSSASRFIWLRRTGPNRLIRDLFVYWESVTDPSSLSKEWMLEKMAKVAKEYYKGYYVYSDSLIKVEEELVNFYDNYSIKLEGIWQDDSLNVGGPFRSYAFYDETDGRIYLLDGSVWAPEQRKWPFLRQLDIIMQTFKTKAPESH
ncbi:DUF4837 family protein [candidate division KSB1 bacterium]|nr:DUF4837 family protein [candidate division KSB1 bacterium]